VMRSLSLDTDCKVSTECDCPPPREAPHDSTRNSKTRSIYYRPIQTIFHFSTAALISRPISSLALFFALVVTPSTASSCPGDVFKGSNSSRCPSDVGRETRAVIEGEGTWEPLKSTEGSEENEEFVHVVENVDGTVDDCELEDEEGSRRTLILLRVFFSLGFPSGFWDSFKCVAGPCLSDLLSSPSLEHKLANQPNPSLSGLASGDPFKLSMSSSRRGSLVVPGAGNTGTFGIAGAKVSVDGGRI
jgi:hypothetical protein